MTPPIIDPSLLPSPSSPPKVLLMSQCQQWNQLFGQCSGITNSLGVPLHWPFSREVVLFKKRYTNLNNATKARRWLVLPMVTFHPSPWSHQILTTLTSWMTVLAQADLIPDLRDNNASSSWLGRRGLSPRVVVGGNGGDIMLTGSHSFNQSFERDVASSAELKGGNTASTFGSLICIEFGATGVVQISSSESCVDSLDGCAGSSSALGAVNTTYSAGYGRSKQAGASKEE